MISGSEAGQDPAAPACLLVDRRLAPARRQPATGPPGPPGPPGAPGPPGRVRVRRGQDRGAANGRPAHWTAGPTLARPPPVRRPSAPNGSKPSDIPGGGLEAAGRTLARADRRASAGGRRAHRRGGRRRSDRRRTGRRRDASRRCRRPVGTDGRRGHRCRSDRGATAGAASGRRMGRRLGIAGSWRPTSALAPELWCGRVEPARIPPVAGRYPSSGRARAPRRRVRVVVVVRSHVTPCRSGVAL